MHNLIYSLAIHCLLLLFTNGLTPVSTSITDAHPKRDWSLYLPTKVWRASGMWVQALSGEAPKCTSSSSTITPSCNCQFALVMRAPIALRTTCPFARRVSYTFLGTKARAIILGSVGRQHVTNAQFSRSVSLVHRQRFYSHHSHVDEPTIYALSTASGRAAIAVIRVSGPACRQVSLITIPPTVCIHPDCFVRSIRVSAHPRLFQSHVMRHCESYMLPMCRPRLPLCSTREL